VAGPRSVRRALLGALCLGLLAGAVAADFPQRPVRMIVPFGAGGPTDIVARLLAQGLSTRWAHQVVIENRPGAGGNLGADIVAKAPPDGYTLGLVPAGPITINPSLFEHMPFDPARDLAPVSLLAVAPIILYVTPGLPAHSLAELIALARARPGALNFTSAGTSSLPHLAGEMFRRQMGVDVVHVPYKGAPQAVAAVVAGEGAFTFDTGASLPLVGSGRLRALAVTGAARDPQAPELPTFVDSGFPDFNPMAWSGLVAPAGMAATQVRWIQQEAAQVLLADSARERLAALGFVAVAGTPESFAAFIGKETARWAVVIRGAGIHVE
jgi:tripartite-type tricarboxylate transporter receptor subunit TctC